MTLVDGSPAPEATASGVAPPSPFTLDDKYRLERGRIFLSGTQALVRLPMMQRRRDRAAGLNTAGFVSGYRGSPLAGLDREFGRARAHLDRHHVVFRPGVNEDLAATAVWGTQQVGLFPGARYDGVFSLWYGKGPGVDRSMDVIRHANAAGTGRHGGVLLLCGDDHGASSSTLPHQSEHDLIAAMVPMLAPAGVGEYLDFGLLGIAMSRFSGCWVGFKCQTEIVESSAAVEIDPEALAIVLPALDTAADDRSLRWPDGPRVMEERLVVRKLPAVEAFARANRLDRIVVDAPGARLGIVASGKAWLDLLGALAILGIDERRAAELGLRLYKVGLVWPLEPQGLEAFAEGLDQILVVEEKRPVVEDQIKALLFNRPDGRRPSVVGKRHLSGAPLLPVHGEIDPPMVAAALIASLPPESPAAVAGRAALARIAAGRPSEVVALRRDPFFCSGCPHSRSTRLPEGSRASTGIGCHMMVIGQERDTATFTQMGGEGVAWTGMAPFTDETHIFVNMGDGTYFHSGVLAIRAAIAARVNATYKILYNDAVAMTGGQPHDGDVTVPGIVSQVLAEGATAVAVVSERTRLLAGLLPRGVGLHERDAFDALQRDFRERPGVTVIVYDQVCAAEKRRRRKRGTYPVSERRAFINDLVCEGCGDCSRASNCISVEPVETEFGRKRRIDQSSCNTDLACVDGFCPSFVTVEGGRLRRPAPRTAVSDRLADLPDPPIRPLERPVNILLAGIGGTGVITVSAILATAAHIDGRGVLALDQTGLAQKNGAVVSHIRIAPAPRDLAAIRIAAGETDLLLGFDMIVAGSAATLATMAPGRARAIVDDHVAPTAAFVGNGALDFRREGTMRSIQRATGDGSSEFVAATRLATAVMGDAIAGNIFLLGHAWQRGLVPVSHAALMHAIEANGAAVAMNKAAFAWGRLAAVDPAAVEAAAGGPDPAAPAAPATLDDLVARRAAFLADYQDATYAARYRALVATARAAEAKALPEADDFARAVAVSAFKLMAYKDEYEVARLHAGPAFAAAVAAGFEGDYRLRYHLAPPMIAPIDPATGHPRKLSFGPWMGKAFRLLAKGKWLRGTLLDPFGYTTERQAERRAVADFEGLVRHLADRLDAATHATAVELARLPQDVRGFGHVKTAAAEKAATRRRELLATLGIAG